uniref:Uncharacterized protein n=1 Tax=Oryza brachyantha TaxID=4533 RepID=J3LMX3_ORYBR
MQVLVGQMYRSGYGVNKNEHKIFIGSGMTFLLYRLKFGWRKHHDTDLQSGKLAANAQYLWSVKDTMLVTQIQMILRKQANKHMLLERVI